MPLALGGWCELTENTEDMVSTLMVLAAKKRKCAKCFDGGV